ncbi:MAG TPA: right-handed parallel beta-helix repeat-containing protein, partial [Spirochaetota bacterium]|nr:right-handed parallel beta-helix repeat-containing protein [Spirochaetota bacterium]
FITVLSLFPQLVSNTVSGYTATSIADVANHWSTDTGDLIVVFDGTYAAASFPYINKTNIRIVSLSWLSNKDNSAAVVDGGGSSTGLNIGPDAAGVIIEGITFQYLDLGIGINSSHGHIIRNNTFFTNRSVSGGGVRAQGGDGDNLIFSNNLFNGDERGIWLGSGNDNCLISNNNFINQTKDGILLGTVNTDDMSGEVIADNFFSNIFDFGIAINHSAGDAYVYNTVIKNNTMTGIVGNTGYAAGVWMHNGRKTLIKNNTFSFCENGTIDVDISMYNTNVSNTYYSNYKTAVKIDGDSGYSYIAYNKIIGALQTNGVDIEWGIGIYCSGTAGNSIIYRNLVKNYYRHGIDIFNGAQRIINNTVTGTMGPGGIGCGIFWNTGSSGDMFNNILISNVEYGAKNNGTGTVNNGYNIYWGNANAATLGTFNDSGSNINADPLLNTAGDYEITSTNSPAFDTGTNLAGITTLFNSLAPDRGWKEFELLSDLFIAETNTVADSYISSSHLFAGWASNIAPAYDPIAVYFRTNSGLYSSVFASVSNTAPLWNTNVNTAGFPDGETVTCTFLAVNSNFFSNTCTVPVIADNSPPVLAVAAPAAGDYISSNYTFAGTNYDLHSGIATASLVISNAAGDQTNINIGTASNWSLNWNTIAFPDGLTYAGIIATNLAGVEGKSAVVNFNIFNNYPVIEETNTSPGSYISSIHSFKGYALNTGSNSDPLQVYMQINSQSNVLFASNGGWSTNFNTAFLNDGTNIFTFKLVNPAAFTNSETLQLTVDNSPPLTGFTEDISGTAFTNSYTLTITNADSHSGISSAALIISNQDSIYSSNSLTTAAFQIYMLDPVDFTNGNYTVLLRSVNGVGLTNTVTYDIIISNLPPRVTINGSIGNTIQYGNNIINQGTVSGNGSAVTSLILTLSNSSGLSTNADITARISSGNWDYIINSLDDPVWSNGIYYASVYAENAAGFSSSAGPVEFTINNIAFKPVLGPNPAVNENIRIHGLHWDSRIYIYTVNGIYIKKFTDMHEAFYKPGNNIGRISWDTTGSNDKNLVSSGIYLVYIYKNNNTDPQLFKITIRR